MPAASTAPMTFADLEKLPDSDTRYELRHGELIELPPSKLQHYRIQHAIRRALERAVGDAGTASTAFGFRPKREHEYRFADEQICLENGGHEFRVVDPVHAQVRISTRDGRSATYKSGQEIRSGREIHLPWGGTLAVETIFA